MVRVLQFGKVDIQNPTIVLTDYGRTGMTWSQGDFQGDGRVDINDLTIVLSNFGKDVGLSAAAGTTPVPEPGTFLLLGIGAVGVSRLVAASLTGASIPTDDNSNRAIRAGGWLLSLAVCRSTLRRSMFDAMNVLPELSVLRWSPGLCRPSTGWRTMASARCQERAKPWRTKASVTRWPTLADVGRNR